MFAIDYLSAGNEHLILIVVIRIGRYIMHKCCSFVLAKLILLIIILSFSSQFTGVFIISTTENSFGLLFFIQEDYMVGHY